MDVTYGMFSSTRNANTNDDMVVEYSVLNNYLECQAILFNFNIIYLMDEIA